MLEIDKYIPQENWFVGLLFDEGYWFFKIVRKQQQTIYAPYEFNSNVAVAAGSTSDWETPTDSLSRYYLTPPKQDIVYQFFMGLSPSTTKVYEQFTQREDRMSLLAPRDVPGVIGYWDGEMTPYRDPSPQTELWSVKELYPYFNAENPYGTGESEILRASFYVNPFSYEVVKDKAKIESFIKGDKRSTIRTMGDPFRPVKAPWWLTNTYGAYMVSAEGG